MLPPPPSTTSHGCQQHIDNAKHNRAVIAALDACGSGFSDWEIITYFHLIIHLIEARLARNGEHSNDHRDRQKRVEAVFGRVWYQKYYHIKDVTRGLRYDCQVLSDQYVQELTAKNIVPFIEHICGTLGLSDGGAALASELSPS